MSDSHDVECFPGDFSDATNGIVENNGSRKKKIILNILKFLVLEKINKDCAKPVERTEMDVPESN